MASLSRDKNGTRRILFMLRGQRKCVRLGGMPVKSAQTFKAHVEALVYAAESNTSPGGDTAAWVADLGPDLFAKLEALGLVQKREEAAQAAVKLGEFITGYVKGRTDVKPATKEVWRQGESGLLEFFGADKPLPDVSPGDADNYKLHLVGKKLAPMTVRKRLQFATMVFRAAVRRRLIPESPFAGVSVKGAMKADRERFITREETGRLLDGCPNIDWRAIVALARFGGVRCPSEVLTLKWADIDWERGRFRAHSPKTEHHPGKASREVPLFPELHAVLSEAFEAAADGAVYVVASDTYRKAADTPGGWRNCNLRTQFERIIRRAGLEPWPRLFHNLRASRETELAQAYPVHVVATWLGNTPRVALKHYLMTTEADFERAAGGGAEAAQKAAHSGDDSAQNPAQPISATTRQERQETTKPQGALGVWPLSADDGESWLESLADGEGFEPPVHERAQQFSRLPP